MTRTRAKEGSGALAQLQFSRSIKELKLRTRFNPRARGKLNHQSRKQSTVQPGRSDYSFLNQSLAGLGRIKSRLRPPSINSESGISPSINGRNRAGHVPDNPLAGSHFPDGKTADSSRQNRALGMTIPFLTGCSSCRPARPSYRDCRYSVCGLQ